eukprot:jgi/Chrzof1/5534/Cz16g06190.t1
MRTMLPSVMRMYAAVLVAGLLLFMAAAPGAEATAAKVTAEATAAKAAAEATATKVTFSEMGCSWQGNTYVQGQWASGYQCGYGGKWCTGACASDARSYIGGCLSQGRFYMNGAWVGGQRCTDGQWSFYGGRKMLTMTNINDNSGPAAQVAGAA